MSLQIHIEGSYGILYHCNCMPVNPSCKHGGMAAYPLLLVAMKLDNSQNGAPLPELIDPVVKGGLGHNHHVGP